MNRKKPDEVYLSIRGFKALGEEHFAEEFFQMLREASTSYIPDKIGLSEPLKTPFSLEEVKKIWVESEKGCSFGGVMLKGKKITGDLVWKENNFNSIALDMSRALVIKNLEKYIKLAKNLFLWSNGIYGYACHNSNVIYTPGLSYETCLGHISWMTLFGPPYVKMFGKDVIQKAPCKVEEFAENCFLLLITDEPEIGNAKMLEIQEKVKVQLGTDAFYRDEPRQSILTMEDLKAGKNRPSTDGYRSPDLSGYIKDTKITNDEGLIAKINDDNTITTYKLNLGEK